jgi:predicted ribosome quality control (RQC) complex YloA/Tae2 family protein
MQYASALTYQIIGCYLKHKLQGGVLTDAFSIHKDGLILEFKTSEKTNFQWMIQFVDGIIYFLKPDPHIQPGRKSITQFKPAQGLSVLDVQVFENERIILIQLAHNKQLLIKGFGRLGNVLLMEDGNSQAVALFRLSLKSDRDLDVVELLKKTRPIACSDIPNIQFFTDNSKLFEEPADGRLPLGVGAEGLFTYAQGYVRNRRKETSRQQWEIHWNRQIIMHRARIKNLEEQLAEIENRRSYKELGDIILAHAHQIKKGVGNALLQDFYTQKPIRIKLNPDLDAAENAERFYRKAKNEGLEKSHLLQNLEKTQEALQKAEGELTLLQDPSTQSRIQQPITAKNGKQPESKPYKTLVIEDFEVWLGKSASDNDAMLKLAAKQDMWLHVRGFAGSHVIIKKKGSGFPESVIQKAAELAAKNSKARTQKMVPVIYTERKYVSKPRKAAPGEVAVLKEKVMDIYLK